MKFAIWGAGQKGTLAYQAIGENQVSCFIDSNESLQGNTLFGKPIISFAEYSSNFFNDLIVISMLDDSDTVALLKENSIPFLSWSEAGLLENIQSSFYSDIKKSISLLQNDRIAIWGNNLLSLMLYDFLSKYYSNVVLAKSDADTVLINFLKRNGYKFDNTERPKYVFLANGEWDDAASYYPNVIIKNLYTDYEIIQSNANTSIKKFKQLHQGNRCFIIGNGPSLTMNDLTKLHDNGEICFGVNMIYKAFTKTEWRPQYYVADDLAVLERYGNDIKQLDIPYYFITNRGVDFWHEFNDVRFFKFNTIYCRGMRFPLFATDISLCIYAYRTVLYECLQIAIYMGFNEIYFLGADSEYKGYTSDANNHFIDDYYNANDPQRMPFDQEATFRSYQVAADYAQKCGIKIYNATRGGKLEVFERVDFDSLF